MLAIDPWQSEARAEQRRLDKIRHTGPENQHLLYLQGMELYTSGRYEEAIAAWEKVLSPPPEQERARMNIEMARRKLQQS